MNNKNNQTSNSIRESIDSKLNRYFGVSLESASKNQVYRAIVLTVKDILTQKRSVKSQKRNSDKKIYYLCMEFLIGRSLKNNLYNLGLIKEYSEALSQTGYTIDDIFSCEPDAGLGNGGLGRLAACFMDSMTTMNYRAYGFSICYEYGLFRQKIVDGSQIELPDEWMNEGEVWLIPRTDRTCSVKLGGNIKESWENGKLNISYENYEEINAVPYDMMISGYETDNVGILRLWKAKSPSNFNMSLFSQGEYLKAVKDSTNAEIISKVLYPSDNHTEGKLLRLTQQYFLVSASLQSIINDYLREHGTLSGIEDRIVIHINDTHPAMCIPELMRIMLDQYSYSWENAWRVVSKCVSYTNHTVMPEALECWNTDLFKFRLPRIYMIIEELNKRLCADLWNIYPGDWDRISRMSIISNSEIRMANLSVYAANKVNGVSELHSDILKKSVFRDYAKTLPYKFLNVTNGIAHRRWLCQANPALTELLDECIGPEYKKQPSLLENFKKFSEDKSVLERIDLIKSNNKRYFTEYLLNRGINDVNSESIFDVQVKRMHEYKRQLLNVLKIISYCNDIEEDPGVDFQPQTFIFGGKAAPGYYMAKEIIRLICALSEYTAKSPVLKEKLRVIYLENYDVSTAEILIPASDISEQISLAGKEASGTGCMKFMINGALTVGTLDGANVEMMEKVGEENIYIFGLRATEVDELWKKGYSSIDYYNKSIRLRKATDRLNKGFGGIEFDNIARYLTSGNSGIADPYMCFVDFDSYVRTCGRVIKDYENKDMWLKKSVLNIAAAGYFSSDRSILEYAEKIWGITHTKKV
ncbi:MAG: glycogen/starch/alpha-glucan phosphorylase [Clostridia bacterium]|nr:glycogen/starch/alpha-glucan phosphorylase [Clostridia bacterium]